jgi:hypothetical protein
MARGQDAKLRRRQNRAHKAEAEAMLNEGTGADDDDVGVDDDLPLPPKMAAAAAAAATAIKPKKKKSKESVVVETVTSDEEDDDGNNSNGKSSMPKIKSPVQRNRRIPQHHGGTAPGGGGGGGGLGSIKRGPLILLIILTGTTLLPAVLYAGDYVGKYLPNVVGNVGFRLGMGTIPKKRVTSFYEKHAPEKLAEVPKILGTHYGDYPTLIKKLERKYQDYGYFIGWENDEAPAKYVQETLQDLYGTWIRHWNKHAPQVLKTAFRNIRYNLTTLYKKGHKIWRKKVWPYLEPVFGVPKGAEKQKRQDAAEARKRQRTSGSSTTRRKNRDFRDDEE